MASFRIELHRKWVASRGYPPSAKSACLPTLSFLITNHSAYYVTRASCKELCVIVMVNMEWVEMWELPGIVGFPTSVFIPKRGIATILFAKPQVRQSCGCLVIMRWTESTLHDPQLGNDRDDQVAHVTQNSHLSPRSLIFMLQSIQ